MNKILLDSAIIGVKVGSRLLNIFKKRISLILSVYKKARKAGGTPTKRLLNTWKNTNFKVNIYYTEIDVIDLSKKNEKLQREKRALEDQLEVESAKRIRLENDMNILEETVKTKEIAYKGKFKQLVKKIARITANKKGRGPANKKEFKDYTKQHQTRVRKQLKEQCETGLSFLGLYEFVPSKVELYNKSTGEVECFSFIEDDVNGNEKEMSAEEVNDLNTWLYLKDRFNISNEAWHEISMKSDESPCLNRIIKHMNKINKNWNLKPTPGEQHGIQMSFRESIIEQIKRLRKAGVLNPGEMVKVKISGDGTKVGKRLNIVNITYTIINEKNRAMSEKGNYLLAVVKTKESYDTLAESLSNIIEEMEQTTSINVDGTAYPLEYFLGGDWKFLACVCGIGGANADYACIWCTCPKKERHNMEKSWSILDPELGARSLEKIRQFARTKKYNCNHAPLFSFIPTSHVVIDTLHLYLRITDNLIELIIRELKRCDAIEKKKTFTDNFERDKYKHMAEYEKYLQSLGIQFQFYVGKATKQLEYRDLTGPEKQKLFKNVNIVSLLPNCPHSEKIQEIWNDFTAITDELKQDVKLDDVDKIKTNIKMWMNKFLTVYQTKDVTPYMHAFSAHVPEFLSLYGNIEQFTQQGMEKYNDITSKNFFRSTNHQGISAIRQLFFKRKRVQFLEAAGCSRVKRAYTCSNCNEVGHTIKTCTAKCSSCNHGACCSHLSKIDGKYRKNCTVVGY